MSHSEDHSHVATALVFIILTFVLCWIWPLLPTHDNPTYFNFADHRSLGFINNAQDVLSNLAFLFVGLWGALQLKTSGPHHDRTMMTFTYVLVFASILTSFGSAYFHFEPTEKTLFFDRMPMTLGFSSVCALLATDRISQRCGLIVGIILLPLGLATVIGWNLQLLTLRPYSELQFGSLVFILLIALIKRRGQIPNHSVGSGLALYVLAKVFEMYDKPIFKTLGFVSGHTLKHLAAAAAIFFILSFVKPERP